MKQIRLKNEVLKISMCDECPIRYYRLASPQESNDENYCRILHKDIIDDSIVYDMCPLEDVTEDL